MHDLYAFQHSLTETFSEGNQVMCRPARTRKQDNFNYIMRIRSKSSLQLQNGEEQFRSAQVRMLNFPAKSGVLPVHEVLEDSEFYYIVCPKPDRACFLSRLLGEYSEQNIPINVLKQLAHSTLQSVRDIHKLGVLHRDIKPENLLLQAEENVEAIEGTVCGQVVLSNFDNADPLCDPNTPSWRSGVCGSIRFSAPEALIGQHCQASDLYSVGVILYLAATGAMPFEDRIYEEEVVKHKRGLWRKRHNWRGSTFARMKAETIDWSQGLWADHPYCKEFCEALLQFDPQRRFQSADEALCHEWFQGY